MKYILLFLLNSFIYFNPCFSQINQTNSKSKHTENLKMTIDSLMALYIGKNALPGAVIAYSYLNHPLQIHSYGQSNIYTKNKMSSEEIFDLASITKIAATTLAIMKLYEQHKLNLDSSISTYLPEFTNSNKSDIKLRDILLHQAGLIPYIKYYELFMDSQTKSWNPEWIQKTKSSKFNIPIAKNCWGNATLKDTIWKIIIASKISEKSQPEYLYSDLDFMILGKIVDAVSHQDLAHYVTEQFYRPMALHSMGFNPFMKSSHHIVPTENDSVFRFQLLQGYVHDEGAAILGGMAGHAGLFANAKDLWRIGKMLDNYGVWQGKRYLDSATIAYFTAYQSTWSRRGLGFDKPELKTSPKNDGYPSFFSTPKTYGHTGFTGTCIWIDPTYNLVFVFLSNRVHPTRTNNLINQLRVRGSILDTIYSVGCGVQ